MKVFFDTNVYIAEALLGEGAVALLAATEQAGWRIYCSDFVLDEIVRVLVEYRQIPLRFAHRSQRRVLRRAQMVDAPSSRHQVPNDPNDTPILRAAIMAGVDCLVTNDFHLLSLDPYEGIRIMSMAAYYDMLVNEGFLPRSSN